MNSHIPTASELSSFCDGMQAMYAFGKTVRPDLIIFPLRGAQPFSAAYHTLGEVYREPVPNLLLPPLGTCFDLERNAEHGLTPKEKASIIEDGLETYFSAHPNTVNILLVDEVMNGGTIVQHFQLVNEYLRRNHRNARFNVCAIEHGQHQPSPRYRQQATRHSFERVRVESLFVMDREQYLPRVTRNGIFRVEITLPKLEPIVSEIQRRHARL